jgi:HD-GYP domain-containing protein (c-di-GMP phosphodiesterase class II)
MPCLKSVNGQNKGTVYHLNADRIPIGRDETSGVQVVDKGASRLHAEIHRMGEMFFIRDLKSRNGTYVNEERITEELLRSGDRIRIGKTVLQFEESDAVSTDDGDEPRVNFDQGPENITRTMEFKLDDLVLDEKRDLEEDTARAQHGSKHLRVLYQISRAFSTEQDIEKLMENVLKIVVVAVDGEYGFVFARGEGKRELVILASYQSADAVVPGGKPTVSKSIIKHTLKNNRPVMTQDATVDSRFRLEESVVSKQIRSVLCVPVTAMERTTGVIYIARGVFDNPFTGEDLELLTTVGIQAGMALESIRASEKQKETFISAIRMLLSAIELRDPSITASCERIASCSTAMGDVLGMSVPELHALRVGALLHNVSMIAISDREAEEAKRSSVRENHIAALQARVAEKLFSGMKGLEHILPAVKHQAECCDGSGYPDGLKGDAIPLDARIIAVAKEFDQLLYEGNKPTGKSLKDTLLLINQTAQAGRFDVRVARALTIAYRRGAFGVASDDAAEAVGAEKNP